MNFEKFIHDLQAAGFAVVNEDRWRIFLEKDKKVIAASKLNMKTFDFDYLRKTSPAELPHDELLSASIAIQTTNHKRIPGKWKRFACEFLRSGLGESFGGEQQEENSFPVLCPVVSVSSDTAILKKWRRHKDERVQEGEILATIENSANDVYSLPATASGFFFPLVQEGDEIFHYQKIGLIV